MEVAVTGAANRTARRGAQRAAFQRARVAKRRASQKAAGEAPSAQAELSSATLVLQRPDAGAALGVAPTDGQPPKSAVRGHVLPLPPPKRSLRFPAAGLAPIDPMPSGINTLDAEAADVWGSKASGITTVAVPGDRAPGSVAGTALHTACSGADSVVTPCHHHHLLGRPVHQPTRPLIALDETPCAQRSASDLAATVKVTAERTPSPVLHPYYSRDYRSTSQVDQTPDQIGQIPTAYLLCTRITLETTALRVTYAVMLDDQKSTPQ